MSNKTPLIFFRGSLNEESEMLTARAYFDLVESRINVRDRLVIGRYSCLPFYNELERDLNLQGSTLINSTAQHEYIANFEYYEDLKKFTAKTYFNLSDVPKDGGPFVVKGKTNSRKSEWKTKMFAPTFKDAVNIYCELMNDSLIGNQGVVIREYLPLKILSTGVNGMPFSNEWRCFFYKNKLLTRGFYWIQSEVIPEDSAFNEKALSLAQAVADRVCVNDSATFFVVDIAELIDGSWALIELNDGQQSGLSGNSADTLYSNLKKAIEEDQKKTDGSK